MTASSGCGSDGLFGRRRGSKLRGMGDPHADHERVVLLALLDERPLLPDGHRRPSWPDIASEVALRGSAVSLWNEVHPPTLAGMEDATGVLTRARERLQTWRAADFQLVTVLDGEYPLALRMIHQMPPLLFVKGKLPAEEVGVSIIGTREATGKGLSIAAAIATGLAQRGVSVISGLATGIDTAAHRAAL